MAQRQVLIRLLGAVLALGAAAPSLAVVTPAAETGEIPVTDEPGFEVVNLAQEVPDLALSRNRLFTVFARGSGASSPYLDVRLRAWNLLTGAWDGASVVAFARTDPTDRSGQVIYHELPTIIGEGATIHVFDPDGTSTAPAGGSTPGADGWAAPGDCLLSAGAAKAYYRTLPADSWTNATTWSPASATPSASLCSPGSVVTDDNPNGNWYDLAGLSLSDGRIVVHGEHQKLRSAYPGLHRVILRRSAAGAWTGPWVAIHGGAAGSYAPVGSGACTTVAGQNLFPKAWMAPPRVPDETLWMAWSTRREFTCTAGTACSDPATIHSHTFDVSVAKSTDGITWTSVDGASSFTLTADESGAVPYTSTAYRAYAGNVAEKSHEGFDVDAAGRPALLLRTFRSGQADCAGRPDSFLTDLTNAYDLNLVRWTGSAWATTAIDVTSNWVRTTPALVIDRLDRYWLFRQAGSEFSGSTTAMAYTVSTDRGATWQPWAALSQDVNVGIDQPRPGRLRFLVDPMRRWIAFTYLNATTRKMYLKRLVLVPDGTQCCGAP